MRDQPGKKHYCGQLFFAAFITWHPDVTATSVCRATAIRTVHISDSVVTLKACECSKLSNIEANTIMFGSASKRIALLENFKYF